jgi:hypothetical protein
MTLSRTDDGLRRTTGALFVGGALAFAGAATVPSSTSDWPDVRGPARCATPHIRHYGQRRQSDFTLERRTL